MEVRPDYTTCTVSLTLALSSSKGLRNSSQMESSRPSTQEQMLDHSAAHCTVSSEASATGWEKKEDVWINVPGLFVLRESLLPMGVWYYLCQQCMHCVSDAGERLDGGHMM